MFALLSCIHFCPSHLSPLFFAFPIVILHAGFVILPQTHHGADSEGSELQYKEKTGGQIQYIAVYIY